LLVTDAPDEVPRKIRVAKNLFLDRGVFFEEPNFVKRHSATVEPVLGTLINHHCMRRVHTRGMAGANKHVLMAALTYNLKKYLRYTRRISQTSIAAMQKPMRRSGSMYHWALYHLFEAHWCQ
jgi:hypothetical protein